ncbi:DUF6924 domain-containing protein [Amycolatopsis sp. NPDC059090]|uniref:DUF6924 domain-containing protein n=1 Tax=Amycolatopsis sp. NPDC059090 TaxID=3346723 RepID=UPI00366B9618
MARPCRQTQTADEESAERHVLVVGLDDDSRCRTYRTTPPAVQEIENNLSLANKDRDDLADSAHDDGVVRPTLAEVTRSAYLQSTDQLPNVRSAKCLERG